MCHHIVHFTGHIKQLIHNGSIFTRGDDHRLLDDVLPDEGFDNFEL